MPIVTGGDAAIFVRSTPAVSIYHQGWSAAGV